jgi:hypothetical protein
VDAGGRDGLEGDPRSLDKGSLHPALPADPEHLSPLAEGACDG